MKPGILFVVLLVLLPVAYVRADFGGPLAATKAISPDGNLIVRIAPLPAAEDEEHRPQFRVSCYKYDTTADKYVKKSGFRIHDYPGQMLYVSNAGDVVLASLGEENALILYSPEGKRLKSWDLADFLTKEEIAGCAQTGATLQWLDEASFSDRTLYLRGPSRVIRALIPSYTVMRGADEKISYSAALDAKAARLTKDMPEEDEE